MKSAELRTQIDPVAKSLKTQTEKLKTAYLAAHQAYEANGRQIQELREAPPHRDELKGLLGTWLTEAISRQRTRLRSETLVIFERDRTQGDEPRKRAIDALNFEFERNVASLTLALLHSNLDSVIDALNWPTVLDPAERDARLAELGEVRKDLKAELNALRAIADEVGFDLHASVMG